MVKNTHPHLDTGASIISSAAAIEKLKPWPIKLKTLETLELPVKFD